MNKSLSYIDFEPHSCHEYGGHNPDSGNIRRPMVVLSNSIYNKKTGLVIGLAITSASKKFQDNPLMVPIMDQKSGIHGYVSTINLSGFDFKSKNGQIVGKVNNKMLKKLMLAVNNILSVE
ncbi:type II toxin-antitoxin system PemK/MazF family toxin [Companilactobacillus insicii]|uniref:type II toxin-antitoxin system PemK/MazF family toxin n=1 Tax=Companilactobacillus insicii TaxID=1732567 RepID=UPI000F773D60|nr:type II toxin-antitoxin system PemK/MazF family toxin [Companilactobacillus insicii]